MENTCGNCVNVRYSEFSEGCCKVAHCNATKERFIIPHKGELKNGKIGNPTVVTFWRIPDFCPKDVGVIKSEKHAPKKDWVIKEI